MNQILKDIKAIIELSPEETIWWRAEIGKVRKKIVKKPAFYIDKYFDSLSPEEITKNIKAPSVFIKDLRDKTWIWTIRMKLSFVKKL